MSHCFKHQVERKGGQRRDYHPSKGWSDWTDIVPEYHEKNRARHRFELFDLSLGFDTFVAAAPTSTGLSEYVRLHPGCHMLDVWSMELLF